MDDNTRSFYDDDAGTYDSRWVTTGGDRNARVQSLLVEELISDWYGYRILEIGPGTGRFSINLLNKSDRYIAVDLSSKMLRKTRERLSDSINVRTGMSQASINSLPFFESALDAVFCVNVLNHVLDIETALAEISRVLKPGGHFLISFANSSSYFGPIAYVINRRGRAIGKNVYSQWRSFNTFTRVVQEAGLEVKEFKGNVYIPKWLDFPISRNLLFGLDKKSRNGHFARYAPTIFISGTKSIV